jgi:hypothetical protein
MFKYILLTVLLIIIIIVVLYFKTDYFYKITISKDIIKYPLLNKNLVFFKKNAKRIDTIKEGIIFTNKPWSAKNEKVTNYIFDKKENYYYIIEKGYYYYLPNIEDFEIHCNYKDIYHVDISEFPNNIVLT